ncbi:immunity 49 family protein [Nocardia sp. NPDC059228]|uniref:immunity 49 family protein n=1 Tax=Nocardia sp. NPDC059228 TaxID=3346777 RepID=UPI0036BDF3A8
MSSHWTPSGEWAETARESEEDVTELIEQLEQSTDLIDGVWTFAYGSMLAQCAVDPLGERIETWDGVVRTLQIGAALYQVTDGTTGPVECFIDNKVRQLPPAGSAARGTVITWLTTFYLAVICADGARLQLLSEVSMDRLRIPGLVFDDFWYSWADTLATWYRQEPGAAEKLETTIEQSYREVATVMSHDRLDKIAYQPINLFYTLMRSRDEFNEELVGALWHHREYWTATPDRRKDSEGCLALGPLAMACMATDMGVKLVVESEYIPRHLVRGSWRDEFPI